MGCKVSKTVVYTVNGKDYIESASTLESNTPVRKKSKSEYEVRLKPPHEIFLVTATNKGAKQVLVETSKSNPVFLLTDQEFLGSLRDDTLTDEDVALYISRFPESLFIQDAAGRTAVDYATLYHNKRRTLLFVNTKLNYRIARDAKRFMVRVTPVN